MRLNIRRFLQLGLVGFILVLAMFLQDAIWEFVTVFILAIVGEPLALVIGLVLWFAGLAFLALLAIWVVRRFS